MMKNIHYKFLQVLKATLLTVIFSVSGWFVFATEVKPAFTFTQPRVVKCYPNPATSFINFEFPTTISSNNYSLQLYSFSGKKMHEDVISTSKIVVTLNNDFYRGVYIYQVRDRTGRIIETGKFQVVK